MPAIGSLQDMAAPRTYPMAPPRMPMEDVHTDNPDVFRNFPVNRPELTLLPANHYLGAKAFELNVLANRVCNSAGLTPRSTRGLYYIGAPSMVAAPQFTRYIVYAVALHRRDMWQWAQIDQQLREGLASYICACRQIVLRYLILSDVTEPVIPRYRDYKDFQEHCVHAPRGWTWAGLPSNEPTTFGNDLLEMHEPGNKWCERLGRIKHHLKESIVTPSNAAQSAYDSIDACFGPKSDYSEPCTEDDLREREEALKQIMSLQAERLRSRGAPIWLLE